MVEEQKIKDALKQCGYPEWAFKKPKPKQKKNSAAKTDRTKRMVVLPFVDGYRNV